MEMPLIEAHRALPPLATKTARTPKRASSCIDHVAKSALRTSFEFVLPRTDGRAFLFPGRELWWQFQPKIIAGILEAHVFDEPADKLFTVGHEPRFDIVTQQIAQHAAEVLVSRI